MITGHFTLFRNGGEVAKMYPARGSSTSTDEPHHGGRYSALGLS